VRCGSRRPAMLPATGCGGAAVSASMTLRSSVRLTDCEAQHDPTTRQAALQTAQVWCRREIQPALAAWVKKLLRAIPRVRLAGPGSVSRPGRAPSAAGAGAGATVIGEQTPLFFRCSPADTTVFALWGSPALSQRDAGPGSRKATQVIQALPRD